MFLKNFFAETGPRLPLSACLGLHTVGSNYYFSTDDCNSRVTAYL